VCIGVCVSVQISLIPRPLPPGEWPGDEAMYKYMCVWCVCVWVGVERGKRVLWRESIGTPV